MKEKEAIEAEIEKKRIIEFAASLGINLTVVDEPSKVREIPEKYRNIEHNVSPKEF
jgi:PII-like signaling protein